MVSTSSFLTCNNKQTLPLEPQPPSTDPGDGAPSGGRTAGHICQYVYLVHFEDFRPPAHRHPGRALPARHRQPGRALPAGGGAAGARGCRSTRRTGSEVCSTAPRRRRASSAVQRPPAMARADCRGILCVAAPAVLQIVGVLGRPGTSHRRSHIHHPSAHLGVVQHWRCAARCRHPVPAASCPPYGPYDPLPGGMAQPSMHLKAEIGRPACAGLGLGPKTAIRHRRGTAVATWGWPLGGRGSV